VADPRSPDEPQAQPAANPSEDDTETLTPRGTRKRSGSFNHGSDAKPAQVHDSAEWRSQARGIMGVLDGIDKEEEEKEAVQCVGVADRVKKQCAVIGTFFPPLVWVPNYTLEDFKGDINSGLTVGCMLVPQCMAYALLADLPPIYGMYSSVVPLMAYGILGTSRQCGLGPVAVIALMIASTFSSEMDEASKIQQAMYLSFMVGCIMVVMGMFRLGIMVNFISHSVMSAFTSGAGITIGTSQLKHFFGVKVKKYKYAMVFQTWYEIIADFENWSWWTVLMGFTMVALLVFLKMWKGWYPKSRDENKPNSIQWTIFATIADFSALVVALLGILWAYLFHLADIEVNYVGDIPSGLKSPSFDSAPGFDKFEELFMSALTIAIVGYLESIAVCQMMALKFNYKIDANQELIAIGAANFLGSLFGGFPVVGSFSRTAVNGNTGSRTQLCGIITSCIVLAALFLITSWFYYLPLCALAAMVEVAVLNLVDFHEMRMAWEMDKRDFIVMIITFLTTLGVGVKEGLFTGIFVSMALVVQHSAFPRIVVLGKRANGAYRDISKFGKGCAFAGDDPAEEIPGILIVRLDAKLFFANAAKFGEFVVHHCKKRTLELGDKWEVNPERVYSVLIDSRGINDTDLSGLHMLAEMHSEVSRLDITMLYCNINDKVKKRLLQSAINIKDEWLIQEDTEVAVQYIKSAEFQNFILDEPEEAPIPAPLEGRLRMASESGLSGVRQRSSTTDKEDSGNDNETQEVTSPIQKAGVTSSTQDIDITVESPGATESAPATSRSCF